MSQPEIFPQERGLSTDAYNERFFIEEPMAFHIIVYIFDSTAEVDQNYPPVSLEDYRKFNTLNTFESGTPFALLAGYVGVQNG